MYDKELAIEILNQILQVSGLRFLSPCQVTPHFTQGRSTVDCERGNKLGSISIPLHLCDDDITLA